MYLLGADGSTSEPPPNAVDETSAFFLRLLSKLESPSGSVYPATELDTDASFSRSSASPSSMLSIFFF